MKAKGSLAVSPGRQQCHRQAVVLAQDFRTHVAGLGEQVILGLAQIPFELVMGFGIAGLDDEEADVRHSAPPSLRSWPALRILSAAANIRCALRSGIVAPESQF